MADQTFSQSQVHKIFPHIATRTLKSWVESGLVGWTQEVEDKRGLHRSYSLENLFEFAIVAELSELNFSLRMIKGMIQNSSPWKACMDGYLAVYKLYTQDIETGGVVGVQSYNYFALSELEFHLEANRNSPYLVLIKLPVIAQRVKNSVKMLEKP